MVYRTSLLCTCYSLLNVFFILFYFYFLCRIPDFLSTDAAAKKAATGKWYDIVDVIQSSLRAAAFSLPKGEQTQFICSITETEVTHGILDNPRNNSQSCCILRIIEDLATHATASNYKTFTDISLTNA